LGGSTGTVGNNTAFEYSECHASTQANTIKKCSIKNLIGPEAQNKIITNPLGSITAANATEHFVLFSPEFGTPTIAQFELGDAFKTCPGGLSTAVATVTGKMTAVVSGSSLSFAGRVGGELKINGVSAEYEASDDVTINGSTETVALET
jgi:hypothetical protein